MEVMEQDLVRFGVARWIGCGLVKSPWAFPHDAGLFVAGGRRCCVGSDD